MLASWLVSTATSRPQPSAPPAPGTSAARPSSRDVAIDSLARDADHETMRLRERLAEAPMPRRSGRNPFRFRGAPMPRERREVAPPTEAAEPSVTTAVAAAPALPYRLIGIAEHAGVSGAVERQAILSGSGELLIVGADQSVGTRFLVVAVGADAVELFDATTNQPVRLTLR